MRFLALAVMVTACFVLLAMAFEAKAADPGVGAEITVTDNIVARDVEPSGANLTTIAGGKTNFAVDNHAWCGGFGL